MPSQAKLTLGKVQPLLKWAGGKRQLLPFIHKEIPPQIENYFEPFIGGGALLFDLQPKNAIVNDVNAEIINVYETVREESEALIRSLKKFKNEEDYFYRIREKDRNSKYRLLSKVDRAARIIYLNKTCYNGLFRVNKLGQFNAPYGFYKNPSIVNEDGIRAVSEYLNTANIHFVNGDFEAALEGIFPVKNSTQSRKKLAHTLVYFDPPYFPLSKTSNFTGYAKDGFGPEEQVRLKNLCDKIHFAGVKFLLSNSHCKFICDLYSEYKIIQVPAMRSINSVAAGRGKISEVLIKNYE